MSIGDGFGGLRLRSLPAALLAGVFLFGGLLLPARGARAAVPAKTDILLMFDTTGSMGGALAAAAAQVGTLTGNLDSRLPDVQYGVAEVRDYPLYDSGAGDQAYPYKVNQPITADRGAVLGAISKLTARGGGDGPEAYGGALYAATAGTGFGWRSGARRLIVLVADNVPHDDDLNLGIPPEVQTHSSPWNTKVDPGPDGVAGTADDIDWQPLLAAMAHNGVTLAYVLFQGNSSYLPYWKIWSEMTGGAAVDAAVSDLGAKIADIAASGAVSDLPACPVGQVRNADGVCDPRHPTGVQVMCNRGPNPGDQSVCTATVGDASTTETPTSPSGQVTFTAVNGGGFPLGNTCSLKPTNGSPSVSSCQVRYTPKLGSWEFPNIVVEYSGSDKHLPSRGGTSLIQGPVFGSDGKPILGDGEPLSMDACARNADALTGSGAKPARAAIARRYPGGTFPAYMQGKATAGDVLYVCVANPLSYVGYGLGAVVKVASVVTGPAVTGVMITKAVALPDPTSYAVGAAAVPAGAATSAATYMAGDALMTVSAKELEDPPDPKFKQTVKPKRVKAVRFVTKRRKDRKRAALLGRYLTRQLKVAALGNALAATIDKAGGAERAGNKTYQGRQMRLAVRYSKQLVTLLRAQRRQAVSVETAIRRLPGVNFRIKRSMFVAPKSKKAKRNHARALRRYERALRKQRRALGRLGITGADTKKMLVHARNPSYDDMVLELPKDLADLVAGSDARKLVDLMILSQRYWVVEPSVVAAAALK